MAVLNKIRQKTFVLILVIALALFAFILSGLVDNAGSLFSKSPNVVATINGKDITREAFDAKVKASQNPNATSSQIMNQVFEAEVRTSVLQAQYDALGLNIGSEQMIDLLKPFLQSSAEFQGEDGQFDITKMHNYIANLKNSPNKAAYQGWVDYESRVSAGALEQTFFNLIKAGTTATIEEGKLEHKLANDKVDIKFVQIPFASIQDSTITVSEAEIAAYIKDKKEYQVEASRDIQIVQFKEVASLDDEKAIQKDLTDLLKDIPEVNKTTNTIDTLIGFANMSEDKMADYLAEKSDGQNGFQDRFEFGYNLPAPIKDTISKMNVADVYGPYKDGASYKMTKLFEVKKMHDSLKVRHILIAFKDSLNPAAATATKTMAEAKKTADSVLAVIKRDKSKFAELVTSLSADQGSIAQEGVYDYHPEGSMVEAFDAFETSKAIGEMGIVKTKFGFHVMELLDRKTKKEAYKMASIERKIEASIDTEDVVFRDAGNFEEEVNNRDFQEVAAEMNYEVRPVDGIKILDETIPGAGSQRQIVRWAFEDDAEVGDIRKFEVNDGFIVAQIVAVDEAGLMNTNDASVTANSEIRKEKKAKEILARITATTLEELATAENQTVKTASAINMKNHTIAGAGREPLVVGTAFGLAEGETSKLVTGDFGVYLVQVTKITPAVELDNYQPAANQVSARKMAAVNASLYNALKASAEIEDYRATTVQ